MESKNCLDCGKKVEAYLKINLCEKCYEAFLTEIEDEKAEKQRERWLRNFRG